MESGAWPDAYVPEAAAVNMPHHWQPGEALRFLGLVKGLDAAEALADLRGYTEDEAEIAAHLEALDDAS
jgi:hypothetical protein